MRSLTIALLAMVVAAPPVRAAESPKLESVSVHLFLERSGEWSADVTQLKGFRSWNFMPFAEEWQPEERFHNYLLKVTFSSDEGVYEPGTVANVSIITKSGKTVLERAIRGVLVERNGRASVPILVEGFVCEPVVIRVQAGNVTIEKALGFQCGE